MVPEQDLFIKYHWKSNNLFRYSVYISRLFKIQNRPIHQLLLDIDANYFPLNQ